MAESSSSTAEAARQASRECDDALAERRASAPKTRSTAAGAPAGAPRRKKVGGKRKPAGSRWLNYLLALGCLASLLPLWFEYRGHKNEPFVQPHKDDPWVRAYSPAQHDDPAAAATAAIPAL